MDSTISAPAPAWGTLAFSFADRHPLAAVLISLVALVLVVIALIILWLAQLPKMSEEEARARPRFFAAVVVAKKLAPVVVGLAKPLAGLLSGSAAAALVDEYFSPRSKP